MRKYRLGRAWGFWTKTATPTASITTEMTKKIPKCVDMVRHVNGRGATSRVRRLPARSMS
jgi:hypothetical protein